MHDQHVATEAVVAVLRQDPPLVAQIIRMANSAAYAPSEPVGSLERALSFIGFAETHRLVGAVAAIQMADQKIRLYPIDGARLRLSTLFVAVLMEELARPAGESPRSCYTVGLLRTIGMMALEHLAPADTEIMPYLNSGEATLDEWERRYWGMTNVEAAEKILLYWRMPHETVSAIRHHYDPSRQHNPISHLLKMAASAAADRLYAIPGEESYWFINEDNFNRSGLNELDFQTACERAQRKYERLRIAVA